jgi:hypothetical protein
MIDTHLNSKITYQAKHYVTIDMEKRFHEYR